MFFDILSGVSNAASIANMLINLTKRSDIRVECVSNVLMSIDEKLFYLDITVINNGSCNVTIRSWKLGFAENASSSDRCVLDYANLPESYLYALESKCPTLLVPSYMCHYCLDEAGLGKWFYKARDRGELLKLHDIGVFLFLSNGDTLFEPLGVTVEDLILCYNKQRLKRKDDLF